jgi:type I restriction enzyme M protein
MKHGTKLGSRIAEVHNGSSLFTGDAGQGESNIRRWIIENDWLEAIVALPLNMFYNTGIATYVWVLTNRKRTAQGQGAAHRRDAVVQAAAQEPRQEELRAVRRGHPAHLRHVPRVRGDRAVEDLPNEAFGYWKVTVERPLRLRGSMRGGPTSPKEIKALKDERERLRRARPR